MQYYTRILTLLFFMLLCAVRSCETPFKKTQSGMQYKVLQKGKVPATPLEDGAICLLHIRCEDEKGEKMFFDTATNSKIPTPIPYKEQEKDKGGLGELLYLLYTQGGGVGTKMVFRLTPNQLFGEKPEQAMQYYKIPQNTKILVLHIHLIEIMNQEQYEQWAKEQIANIQRQEETRQEEVKAIEQYLQEHNLDAHKTASGLYYIIENPGQGASPQKGDQVQVDYTGYLLNGKVFDTSIKAVAEKNGVYNAQRTYEPLSLEIGTGQVIKGWDEGIGLLKKGGKAKLIIPSTLGYGSQGAGVIPPHAVLVFDVNLVDCQAK